jgi:hypothetical protein
MSFGGEYAVTQAVIDGVVLIEKKIEVLLAVSGYAARLHRLRNGCTHW